VLPTPLAPRLRRAVAGFSLALAGCFNPGGVESSDTDPTSASTSGPVMTTVIPTGTDSSDPTTGAPTTTDAGTSTTGPSTATSSPDTTDGFDCVQCMAPTPKCDGQACVECLGDSDCVEPGEGVCDPAGKFCRPCLRHSDCDLACELDVGACFPKNDTENGCEFESCTSDALCCSADAAVKRGAKIGTKYIVVRLSHGSAPVDDITVTLSEDLELGDRRIAILGEPTLSRLEADTVAPLVFLGTFNIAAPPLPTKMYLSHLRISGGAGVWCQRAQLMWVADSLLVDNDQSSGVDVRACALTMERSLVLDNAGGVEAQDAAHVRLFNTVVGGSIGRAELTAASNAVLEGVYVTIADEPTKEEAITLACGEGGAIHLRNSIVAAAPPNPPVDCNGTLTIDDSLVAPMTLAGEGQGNIGVADPALDIPFKSWPDHDFLLDPAKPGNVSGIAVWTENDPPTDIDDTPRPTIPGSPDYPGADIPR
jgi:hypothetical protein